MPYFADGIVATHAHFLLVRSCRLLLLKGLRRILVRKRNWICTTVRLRLCEQCCTTFLWTCHTRAWEASPGDRRRIDWAHLFPRQPILSSRRATRSSYRMQTHASHNLVSRRASDGGKYPSKPRNGPGIPSTCLQPSPVQLIADHCWRPQRRTLGLVQLKSYGNCTKFQVGC